MKYYEYEKWQLDKYMGEYFIIITGPRWVGKSYFIKNFMEQSSHNYIIIDAFKAWKEKNLWLHKAIVKDIRESIQKKDPTGAVVSFKDVKAENFHDFRSFLQSLEDETYVVLDHADYLRYARGVDFREITQEWIDKRDNIHFIFVAKGTPALLNYLGPSDPRSPLFMRYEKYVEVVELSPNETKEFVQKLCPHLQQGFEVYRDIGGLRGYLKKFADVGCNKLELKKLLERELKQEIRGKNTWNTLKVIAKYTRIKGYAHKSMIKKETGKPLDYLKDSIETLVNNGLIIRTSTRAYKTPKILARFLT